MAGYRSRRRANGEGTIYQDRGRWRGAVAWTDRDGVRQRRVVSGKTQAEVRQLLAELRAKLDRGLAPAKPQTLAEFLPGWLEASRDRLRPSSWHKAEQLIRVHVLPALGRHKLAELSPSDVERMTREIRASGRSPRTAQLARAILRRALADALRDGLVHRNVAALASSPHVPVRALEAGRDYLSATDARRLINESRLHPTGPIVALAATTGLRQGELLGLFWTDVDADKATLAVRRALARSWDGYAFAEPKTDKSRRTINLPAAALAALERQRALQDAAKEAAGAAWQDRAGLVFTDSVGRPLRSSDVTHAFQKLLATLGLPHIPFHGLRHTYATAALSAGVSLRTVSDALGHSTITMTADRYAGVTPDQRREAAEAIDRALGGGS